jgi:hypothetical protein
MLKSQLFDHKRLVLELSKEIDQTEKQLKYLRKKRVESLKILLEAWRIEQLSKSND